MLLAASPIESARLLLLSDLGGPGLGNSSGLVGRNVMFHHQTLGVGIYRQDLHGERGKSVTTGFSDFRGVPNDPQRPLGGIVEFGTNSEKIADVKQYMDLGFTGATLKSYMRSSPFGRHISVLIMQGEDAPQLARIAPEIRERLSLEAAREFVSSFDRPNIRYTITDSDGEVRFDRATKPGVTNLLEILAACTGEAPEALATRYTQYGPLKTDTGEAVVELLRQGSGSRGSHLVLAEDGLEIHKDVVDQATGNPVRFKPENVELRKSVLRIEFDPKAKDLFTCVTVTPRPAPTERKAFEPAWQDYREGKIYDL